MKIIMLILLSVVLAFAGKNNTQEDPAFKQYFKAYELVLDGEWTSSIKEFKQLIDKYSKSQYVDDAYFWIAYATLENGDESEAKDLFGKFITQFPNSNLVDDARKYSASLNSGKSQTSSTNRYDSDEIDIQKSVVEALRNQNTEEASKKLYTIAMSKNYDNKVRESAIFWISQSSKTKVADMNKMYQSLDSEKLKEKVIFSITQLQDDGKFDALYSILKDQKESDNLREKALFWLFQSDNNTNKLSSILNELIESTKNNIKLREKLMFSIYNSNLSNKNDILYKFAMDTKEDKKVREKAIFWISQDGGFDQLKRIYAQINDEKLKEKLIFSFHQINTEESIDYMIKLLNLKTTPIKVKKKIIFWLGQSDSKKAKDAILNLLED